MSCPRGGRLSTSLRSACACCTACMLVLMVPIRACWAEVCKAEQGNGCAVLQRARQAQATCAWRDPEWQQGSNHTRPFQRAAFSPGTVGKAKPSNSSHSFDSPHAISHSTFTHIKVLSFLSSNNGQQTHTNPLSCLTDPAFKQHEKSICF